MQGPAWPPALCSAAWHRGAQTTSKGTSRSISAPETQRERTWLKSQQWEEALRVEDLVLLLQKWTQCKETPRTRTHAPQAEPATFRSSARGTPWVWDTQLLAAKGLDSKSGRRSKRQRPRSEMCSVMLTSQRWEFTHRRTQTSFPGGASRKESTCRCRRHKRLAFHPRVRKTPWRRTWQPTPVFLPGECHGQKSLAGYSPWGPTKSGKTLSTAL